MDIGSNFTKLTQRFYHKKATCIKCGDEYIIDTFITEGDRLPCGDAVNDFVQRVCENCGYTWEVLPIDDENYPEELEG